MVAAPMIVEGTEATPPRKRQRQVESQANNDDSLQKSQTMKRNVVPTKAPKGARLFAPFRALGLITNHVPFVLQARSHKGATDGPRVHILTCLGRSWALWEGGKMGLLFVGPEAPEHISWLEMDGDAVWVAAGPHAIKYLRGKEVLRVANPLESSLSYLIVFGNQILALTEDGTKLLIWNKSTGDLDSTILFEPGFTATSILHPATYLNKVLVASSQGTMQLWNIQTQNCLYKFAHNKLATSPNNTTDCAISALVQSPAIDVIGIGFTSGEVVVHDVRTDERLMRMFMEGGSIKAIGFRSDGEPILATANSAGHLALWDLNENGRLLHMVRGAHDGAIGAVSWVPGQPVLVTSGDDNSVKQWLFDSPTAAPHLLKFRSGHHTPPHLIRYYGDDGKQLLTASRDRSLRCTSVVRDSRSFEMSQGSLMKKATSLSIPLASLKFPPVTAISYSSARAKDWDDILTAHTDESFARSWTMLGKKVGKYSLGFSSAAKGKSKTRPLLGSVKAVCVSACGNFGLASSSTGAIHSWNLQSGILRKTYNVGPCPPEAAGRFHNPAGSREERSITGLAADALNVNVIASTLDGTLNFFDFHTSELEETVVLPSAIVSIMLHRDSGLLAVVCDDLVVRLVDVETRRLVREFTGFRARVLDITFSPDSRWLITTSLDSIIRTFDVPTGRLIDAFRTSSVATSVSFSPTNDFLATAHVDSVGIFLWANRAQYDDISFKGISEDEIDEVNLPSMQGAEEDEALEGLEALSIERESVDVFSTPLQLEGDLITLTLLPRARWQTLIKLDIIQQRNKPKEPPKAPEKAPFFLPTLPGVESRFVIEEKKTDQKDKKTRRLDQIMASVESVFFKKLMEEDQKGYYDSFFTLAKTLSPAALDLEIRSIVGLDGLARFLNALTRRLRSHRDFEAVQAMQNVFLRIHSEIIISNEELRGELEELQEAQSQESRRVLELVSSSLGTLGFVRDTV